MSVAIRRNGSAIGLQISKNCLQRWRAKQTSFGMRRSKPGCKRMTIMCSQLIKSTLESVPPIFICVSFHFVHIFLYFVGLFFLSFQSRHPVVFIRHQDDIVVPAGGQVLCSLRLQMKLLTFQMSQTDDDENDFRNSDLRFKNVRCRVSRTLSSILTNSLLYWCHNRTEFRSKDMRFEHSSFFSPLATCVLLILLPGYSHDHSFLRTHQTKELYTANKKCTVT